MTSTDKRREEIARIIDPDLWRWRDRYIGRARNDAVERERVAVSVVGASLAKADAIMALPPLEDSPSPPKEGGA